MKIKSEEDETNIMDDFLVKYGEIGKYQTLLYTFYSTSIFFAFVHYMCWPFIGASLPHRCLLSDEDNRTTVFNTSALTFNDPRKFTCEDRNRSCNAYVYDTSQIQDSVIKEWNLVCDRGHIKAAIGAAPMMGSAIGGLVMGYSADRFGRKPVFFFSMLLLFLSEFMSVFGGHYILFAVCKAFMGFAVSGAECTGFILGIELIGPSKRAKAAMFTGFIKILAMLFIAAAAFVFNYSWRVLTLVYTLPLVLYGLFVFAVPESPRWLLQSARYDAAFKIMKKILKVNGYTNYTEIVDSIKIPPGDDSKSNRTSSFFSLFSLKHMRMKMIVLTYIWILCACLSYVLLLDQSEISNDVYLAFTLPFLATIPGNILLFYSLESKLMGRKRSLVFCLILAGGCLIIHPLLPFEKDFRIARSIISLIGRVSINCSFNILHIFSPELLPTCSRGIGYSFLATIGKLAGAAGPYFLLLTPLYPVIFGIASFIGGLLCFILPETKGKKLPNTFEESEKNKICFFKLA